MKFLLRLLCYLVDFIIVMFAAQVVLIGFFDLPMNQGLTPITFFIVIFCVYNVLFTYYMNGQTPGKALGRLFVVDEQAPVTDGERRLKPELSALFLRESCKAFYSFPVVGWVAGVVAVFMLAIGQVPLHDRVGRTIVVFVGKSKK